MDHIDKKLLSLLQKSARLPLKQLASRVFLTSPAVSARMDRLEKSGVILAYQAITEPAAVGYFITAFVRLMLHPKMKGNFLNYVANCPNVLECNCMTGQYSMLIKTAFPTTGDLDQFVDHLQRFGATETQIVFSTPVKSRSLDLYQLETCEDPVSVSKAE